MPLLQLPTPAVAPPHGCGLISSSTLPSQSLSLPSHSSADGLQLDIGAAPLPADCEVCGVPDAEEPPEPAALFAGFVEVVEAIIAADPP
jgi:hypothetical protein